MTILESLPMQDIDRFCQRWQILELSLFGSVLREDFNPDSDVDMLVTFSDNSDWSLFDHVQMQQELQALLDRKVDLISRRALAHSKPASPRGDLEDGKSHLYPKGRDICREVMSFFRTS